MAGQLVPIEVKPNTEHEMNSHIRRHVLSNFLPTKVRRADPKIKTVKLSRLSPNNSLPANSHIPRSCFVPFDTSGFQLCT